MKKIVLSLSLILILALGSLVVFADSTQTTVKAGTPVQILESLTDLTAGEILALRQSGKTLSMIAQDQGVFDAYISAAKESRIVIIEKLVTDGRLSRERADLMIKYINEHECDGTQAFGMRNELNNGERFGLGFGNSAGAVRGQGLGRGLGNANGTGRGMMRGAGGNGAGFGANCFNASETVQ